MPAGRVRLHMPTHMTGPGETDLPRFYRVLRDGLVARGAVVSVEPRRQAGWETAPEVDFHFVHQGNVRRPRLLNTAIAYLLPFYYADPQGIYFESSLTTARFDPAALPADRAAAFFQALRDRHVTPRRSRYDQPQERAAFPPGAIAVFLQDWSDPLERARHMSAPDMLRAVLAHRAGRPVIVKPHPRNQGSETLLMLHELRKNHRDVIITEANIHDIFASAAVTVSISSSVAMEGMLHRVPAVLFGRSDMHHCAETVTRAEDWPAALQGALTRDWPFEAFLLWFLRRRSLNTGEGMFDPLLARMTAAGADLAALGLQSGSALPK